MTAFRRLSGTTWSSDFSRPFVISFLFLDDYRRALLCSRRPRDLPGKERRTSVSLPSPLRAINQRISGFNAVGHLTLIARLTALRFRSVQHGTLDFHRTPLFRGFLSPRSMPLSLRCRVPSVWAPRGLTFSFQVHLLFCAHAGPTYCSAAPSALRWPGRLKFRPLWAEPGARLSDAPSRVDRRHRARGHDARRRVEQSSPRLRRGSEVTKNVAAPGGHHSERERLGHHLCSSCFWLRLCRTVKSRA